MSRAFLVPTLCLLDMRSPACGEGHPRSDIQRGYAPQETVSVDSLCCCSNRVLPPHTFHVFARGFWVFVMSLGGLFSAWRAILGAREPTFCRECQWSVGGCAGIAGARDCKPLKSKGLPLVCPRIAPHPTSCAQGQYRSPFTNLALSSQKTTHQLVPNQRHPPLPKIRARQRAQ